MKTTSRRLFAAIALMLAVAASRAAMSQARADDPPVQAAAEAVAVAEKPKFIQVKRGADDEPLALQTVIIHFKSDDPTKADLSVDLVGAIHIADKAYFEELNKLFATYDVVLYELVAPEGAVVEPGARRNNANPISMLQNSFKDMLGLEHQLEFVDYKKPNMVHADMSPEQFEKAMADRQENMGTMLMKLLSQSMSQQTRGGARGNARGGRNNDAALLSALLSGSPDAAMKRVMIDQFEDMDMMMAALSGPSGSAIVTDRNKVALGKLTDQLAAGKKKIAIFYGAGHLEDFQTRLTEDHKLKRTGQDWLTAWNLEPPTAAPAKPAEAKDAPAKPTAEKPEQP